MLLAGKSQDGVAAPAMRLRSESLVIVVGIGNIVETELQLIASAPTSSNVYVVEDFADLETIEERISQTVCTVIRRRELDEAS